MHLAARRAALDHRREDLLHHPHVATEAPERLDVVVHDVVGGLLDRHRRPRPPDPDPYVRGSQVRGR